MRDRCKKLAFLTQFHTQYASARILREEKPCFFVDNKWYKKDWSRCATDVKK